MARVIGYVKSLEQGTFFVKDAKGHVHQLKIGEAIHEGELVYGAPNNPQNAKIIVDLTLDGMGDLQIAGNAALNFDTSLLKGIFSHQDAVVSVESVKKALSLNGSDVLDTKNTTEAGDETAAGNTLTDQERANDTFNNRDAGIGNVSTNLNFTGTGINEVVPRTEVFRPLVLETNSDIPTIAIQDSNTIAEDTTANGNVLSNDSDVDSTLSVATFTVNGVSGTFNAGETVTISNVGTVTIATNGDYTFTPVSNWSGSVPTVNYTTNTGSASTLDITVTPVDDPSVLVADTNIITEDTTASGNVLSNDSDVDSTLSVATFTVNGVSGTFNAGETVTIANVGTVTIATNGDYTFTPVSNWSGSVPTVNYTTNTGSTSRLDISVSAVADAPTVALSGSATFTQVIDVMNVTSTDKGFTVSAFHTDGSDATLNDAGKSTSVGFGVDGNVNGGVGKGSAGEIQYDTSLKASETIEVTFENAVTSIDVSFARQSVTESTKVEFYIGDTKVGESIHTGGSNLADSAIHLSATGDVAFDRVVFSAPNAGDDFRIHSISFERTNTSEVAITTDDESTVSLEGIVQLVDTDNSETLSAHIGGIPDGYTLSDGTHTFSAVSGMNDVDVTEWDLAKMHLIVPTLSDQSLFELTITGVSKELSNNDTVTFTDTLAITVLPHNSLPSANDDTGVVNQNNTLSVSAQNGVLQSSLALSGKDTDPDGNALIVVEVRAGEEKGTGATFSVVDELAVEGTYGHLTLHADGSYTYVADKANTLTGGMIVNDTFTYSVSDANGGSDTAELTITVVGSDRASVLVADTSGGTEDTPISGNVLSNDSDVDTTLSVATFSVEGMNGTFSAGESTIIANVGTVTIATNGDYTFTPVSNWSGTVPTVNYTTNTGSVNVLDVAVSAVADAPTVDIVGSAVVSQVINIGNLSSTTNGFSVTALNANGTVGTISTHTNPVGFGVVGNTNVTSSQTAGDSEIGYRDGVGSETLVVNFDHAVSSIDVAFSWRNPGETAKVDFYQNGVLVGSNTYTGGSDKVDSELALKPTDGSVFNEVRFSASGSGDDYLINSIFFDKKAPLSTSIMTSDNSSVALDVLSSLADKDASETLSTHISGLPVGYTLTDGSHTFTATVGASVADVTGWNLIGLSLVVPTETTSVTLTLTVTAIATETSNGLEASTSKTIDIVVTPQNDPTIANNDSVVTDEDTSVVIDVLANDTDNDSAKSMVASVTNGANGVVSINADGTLTYTPKTSFNGMDSFAYTNSEGHSAIVNVTINPVDNVTLSTTQADTGATYDGTANNENITGTDGNDLIHGGLGNDTITGGANRDSLYGDEGDDTLVFDAMDTAVDGGSGIDTLILTAGENIDFSALDNVKNIEVIDLNANGSHNIINLTLQDVINITDDNNTLTITGGSDDNVTVPTATGNYSVMQTADAGFDIYTYSSSLGDPTVTVKIEQDVPHV